MVKVARGRGWGKKAGSRVCCREGGWGWGG